MPPSPLMTDNPTNMAEVTSAHSDEINWYCLKTRTRYEQSAKLALVKDVGIEVFCPMLRFERARRSGRVKITEAMFPGYVFARFRYETQHRHVSTRSGVSTIVSFGGVPSIVAPEIIDELRAAVSGDETIEIVTRIAPGTEVQVVEGPLAGIRSVVTRVIPGRARVAILLELLGMSREVEVDESALLPDQRHPLLATSG